MAKKYYGDKKESKIDKNSYSNLPQEVKHWSYPDKDYAVMEGGYVDTQSGLDKENMKMVGKVKKMMRK